MWHVRVIWDEDSNPDGIVQHIAEHGLTVEDVEFVIQNPADEGRSRSTDRACCFGYSPSGDYIIVAYDQMDGDTIYPVTAYVVPER
jgi:uncharacterized DUF497 family protein